MNQQVNPSKDEPLIPQATGGIEDAIMDGTPNQIEIDKDFKEKVINSITPEGESKQEEKSEDVAGSESNNDTYEPAKDFTDFLNKEIAADDQRMHSSNTQQGNEAPANEADLSVLRDLLTENPHMAPAVKEALAKKGIDLEAGDPATMHRLDGMQSTINELTNMIRSDRDVFHGNQLFENVNSVYEEVVKDVPEHQRTLTDFFNNALLRDYDLTKINRELLEGSNKAITSELDNYFNARIKSEGYSNGKSNSVPPSMNSQRGALTPPPSADTKDYGDPRNRPVDAFAQVDADFSKKVNQLFQQ